jgi:hypothetical protein
MSRHLPPRPNLEFLKNQAKERLPSLQQQNASARLADAQHAIAREYGFANWASLKAHVDTLSQQSPFAGTWSIDQSTSSHQRPDDPFRRATLEFDVRAETVTITDVVVDASGREERGVHAIHADGKPHVSVHGYALTTRWRGAYVLEILTQRDGHDVSRMIYEVARDLSRLTLSATSVAHAGYPSVEQARVFDRVAPDANAVVAEHRR